MSFNKYTFQKLFVFAGFLFLLGCASKQTIEEPNPLLESARLQAQNDAEQFKSALILVETENASESDLIAAKKMFDTLYDNNKAYLGAVINSADISFRLGNYEEARALYIKVSNEIENQLKPPSAINDSSGVKKSEKESVKETVQKTPIAPDTILLFQVHLFNQLGLIARQQGNFDAAEAFYQKALALDASNVHSIKNLAILLDLYRGKLAEALVLYEQYQSIVGESDPKVKDWIFDIKNRLPAEDVSDE